MWIDCIQDHSLKKKTTFRIERFSLSYGLEWQNCFYFNCSWSRCNSRMTASAQCRVHTYIEPKFEDFISCITILVWYIFVHKWNIFILFTASYVFNCSIISRVGMYCGSWCPLCFINRAKCKCTYIWDSQLSLYNPAAPATTIPIDLVFKTMNYMQWFKRREWTDQAKEESER